MNLGSAITEIRKIKKLSQGELAELCKISQTSLSQIEKNVKRPHQNNLNKICKALGIPEALLYMYSLEISDVPKRKKEIYIFLFPVVKELLIKLMQ